MVKVSVEFHSSFGFQLILKDIDQSFTLGNLEKQRRLTLERLVNENPAFVQRVGDEYHTKNKSILFSKVIQTIAIIGSPNSDGYVDFTHTINSSQYNYKFAIDIYQSSVQGAEAEKELINKLVAIHQSGRKYDCVVIIRGGGARADFVVFDSYNLARAVAKFPIPIITGIGHHKDVSIVDLLVKASTKTPTKVAEFILAHNRSFEESVIQSQKFIVIRAQQLLGNAQQKLNFTNVSVMNQSSVFLNLLKDKLSNYNQSIVNQSKTILYKRQTNLVSLLNQLLSKPQIVTANKKNNLQNITNNLHSFTAKFLSNQKGYLSHFESLIKIMSPQNILKKGFAIVSNKQKILKNANSIEVGNELTITMETFHIQTKVLSKTPNDGK